MILLSGLLPADPTISLDSISIWYVQPYYLFSIKTFFIFFVKESIGENSHLEMIMGIL